MRALLRTLLGVAVNALGTAVQSAVPPSYPPAPDGLTLYLVGDIHGRLDLLLAVQRQIDQDKARNGCARSCEIYLGDYIDRGPDAAGVVSQLMARAGQVETVFLRGNHEQMLLDFLHGGDCLGDWLSVGGTATLLSYGIPPRLISPSVPADAVHGQLDAALADEHRRFYEATLTHFRVGPYLAVHAGVRPGVRLEDQATMDLLCIRREFLQFTGDLGYIVVHGHTPVAVPELRANRINIDTGAFASNRLTTLRIDANGAHIMPDAIKER